MQTLRIRNVNEAWAVGPGLILQDGKEVQTRNGPALVLRDPFATIYTHPVERVLLDPVRDQSIPFVLLESLWMLAGRDDATFLDQFVSDFSARYAEPDGRQHGAYGKRWRSFFQTPMEEPIDQLDYAVRALRENSNDRQVVLQMWDTPSDLGAKVADKPCNSMIYLRADFGALDMTVCCRSNDATWGCWGANAVHMSMLQEYLAARIGTPVGTYTQISNNLHMYLDTAHKYDRVSAVTNAAEPYPGTQPLVDNPKTFDEELEDLLNVGPWNGGYGEYQNTFLTGTALPLWRANELRRGRQYEDALVVASTILAPDWRAAAIAWLQRRAAKHEEKQHG